MKKSDLDKVYHVLEDNIPEVIFIEGDSFGSCNLCVGNKGGLCIELPPCTKTYRSDGKTGYFIFPKDVESGEIEISEDSLSLNLRMRRDKNKKRFEEQFWISPEGTVYKFKGNLSEEYCSIHSEIARELFPEIKSAADYMMRLGWVMVGSTVYKVPIMDKMPTNSQVEVLESLNILWKLLVLRDSKYCNFTELQDYK